MKKSIGSDSTSNGLAGNSRVGSGIGMSIFLAVGEKSTSFIGRMEVPGTVGQLILLSRSIRNG